MHVAAFDESCLSKAFVCGGKIWLMKKRKNGLEKDDEQAKIVEKLYYENLTLLFLELVERLQPEQWIHRSEVP